MARKKKKPSAPRARTPKSPPADTQRLSALHRKMKRLRERSAATVRRILKNEATEKVFYDEPA